MEQDGPQWGYAFRKGLKRFQIMQELYLEPQRRKFEIIDVDFALPHEGLGLRVIIARELHMNLLTSLQYHNPPGRKCQAK